MVSRLALCILAMLLAGVPIPSFAQSSDSQPSANPFPAYTIEFVHYQPDGHSTRRIMAYRSDGSYAAAGLLRDGTLVVDVVASTQNGSFTQLHHDVKAKSTMYGPSFGARLEIPKDPSCEVLTQSPIHTESIIGKDDFLGFAVVKHLTQFYDAQFGSYESWQAPDLACKEIFTRKMQKDQETGEITVFESEATKIVLGEPVPELFEIPADYEELSPSQIRTMQYVKNGWAVTELMRSVYRHKDEQYWSSQVYKPVK